MSNYPPGAENDPNAPYNQPDMSHTHEWEPCFDSWPHLEDGAAIFIEECVWEKALSAEKGYEGGYIVTNSIPCKETRKTRVEAKRAVHKPRSVSVAIPPLDKRDEISPLAENALVSVERAYREGDVDLDKVVPDPNSGHVVAETADYRVVYRAEDANE